MIYMIYILYQIHLVLYINLYKILVKNKDPKIFNT